MTTCLSGTSFLPMTPNVWLVGKTMKSSPPTISLVLMFPGVMYYPWPWHSSNQPDPETHGRVAFRFHVYAPIPDKSAACNEGRPGYKGYGCRFHMPGRDGSDWFTNNTYTKSKQTPAFAPGEAPIYGSGCGANGGNPNGCQSKWGQKSTCKKE